MRAQTSIWNGRSDVLIGVKDAMPFAVPLALIYVGFGALCAAKGISVAATLGMSAFVYSTPLQLLMVEIGGHSLYVTLPLVLGMNARFLFLASDLARPFRQVPLLYILGSATLLIPTVFSATIARLSKTSAGAFAYFVGVGAPLYLVTFAATGLGRFLGENVIPDEIVGASRFAMALFLAVMAARLWPNWRPVLAFAAGGLIAPISLPVLGSFGLLIVPVAISIAVSLLPSERQTT